MDEKTDVCIIGGCGHVGFPLGLAFTHVGKKVSLLDVDQTKIDQVNAGIVPFKEQGADAFLKEALDKKLLHCTQDPSAISNADHVIVVTGTPLDEHLNPRLDAIIEVLDQYLKYFKDDQILILRSTLYPTTSEKINRYFQRKNKNVHVAFCPERIIEGKALEEIETLPQIVSGFSAEGVARAKKLFLNLTKKVIELSPLEAELTKLFANAYRYIHFSISNQFYMISNASGIDFNKIYHAMVEDYPRMKSFPKPGFTAGPCLLKDTMQLSAFAKNNFYLGHAAMLVNENVPTFLIDRLKATTDLHEKSVGILGMAFKAESDDKRESLSYKLRRILRMDAREVYCSDEYIDDKSFISKEELIAKSDIVIIGAPHSAYQSLRVPDKPVIDIWNVLK